jgi:hypothetical protein
VIADDPTGADTFSGEEVVVGRSGAEQNPDGSYHGHVTLLGLLGEEILGIDTDQGESASSPFQPLQDVLDQVCVGSSNNVCLALLVANSATTSSGSQNEFGAARADLGQGDQSASVGAAESYGSLQENGDCQTASAGSEVARARVSDDLDAHILKSDSSSTSCGGGPATENGESSVATANGDSPPLPGGCEGAGGGAEVDGVARLSCNSAESGSQSALSAGVLEGQSASGNGGLANSAASAGSPDGDTPGPTDGQGPDPTQGQGQTPTPQQGTGNPPGSGPGADGDDTSTSGSGSDPAGPATSDAQPGGSDGGSLAFTGANLVLLIAMGLALLLVGSSLALQLDRGTSRRS